MLVVNAISGDISHEEKKLSRKKIQAKATEKTMKMKKNHLAFIFFVAIWVLVNWMMSLEGQKTSLSFLMWNLFKPPSSTWIPTS